MEFGALVAKALLTGAESTEVVTGPGDHIIVEVEVDAALLICEDVSEEIPNGGGNQWCVLQSRGIRMWVKVGQLNLTFDLLGDFAALVYDRSLPGDVEVGLYCHCCVRSTEMLE